MWPVRIALWSAVFLWGGSFLATQVLVMAIPPLAAAGLRFGLSSLLLLGLLWLRNGKFPALARSFWPPVALFGLLAVTLGYAFENIGLQRTSTGNASVIVSLIPAFTVVLAWAVLKEQLLPRQWLGVTLATAGSILLVSQGESVGLSDPLGDLLLLLTAIVNAFGGLIGKQNTDRMDPLLNVAWGFGFGTVLLLPLIGIEWWWFRPAWQFTWQSSLGLAYLVVFASVIAYSAFFWGMSKTSLTIASLPNYFTSIISLGLGALLLGEPLTLGRILCACVVIGGLMLASYLPAQLGRRSKMSES